MFVAPEQRREVILSVHRSKGHLQESQVSDRRMWYVPSGMPSILFRRVRRRASELGDGVYDSLYWSLAVRSSERRRSSLGSRERIMMHRKDSGGIRCMGVFNDSMPGLWVDGHDSLYFQ